MSSLPEPLSRYKTYSHYMATPSMLIDTQLCNGLSEQNSIHMFLPTQSVHEVFQDACRWCKKTKKKTQTSSQKLVLHIMLERFKESDQQFKCYEAKGKGACYSTTYERNDTLISALILVRIPDLM